MTLGNELCPAVLFGNPRTGNEKTKRSLPILVPFIIPLRDLLVDIVVDVIIAMQRLRLTTRLSESANTLPNSMILRLFGTYPNPHGSARMQVWLRDTLLLLITPPEPTPRREEMLANLLVRRMHDLRPRVRGA